MAEKNRTAVTRAQLDWVVNPALGRKALILEETTVLELGDTGNRDLSGKFIAGTVASGRLLVRLTANWVTWIFADLKVTAAQNNLNAKIMDIPSVPGLSAFRPSHTQSVAFNTGKASTQGRIAIASSGVFVQFADPALTYTLMVTHPTAEAWPGVLPGVADGQPIGV